MAAATGAQAQDAAAGKAIVYGRCGACHQLQSPKSGPQAPSLVGVVGRKIAGLPDFNYSNALKSKGGAWTPATIDVFLSSPVRFAPGTRMLMAVVDKKDRANVIAYLQTVK
jgi:cytochrome c